MAPCSPMKVNRLFGAICNFHLQCSIVSQPRNQHEVDSLLPLCASASCLFHPDFLFGLFSYPADGIYVFLRNVEQHGLISQKIVAAVKPSNLIIIKKKKAVHKFPSCFFNIHFNIILKYR
jgi:hypothetical protein